MSKYGTLFARGYQILSDRDRWEQRQRRWYLMRHNGIRRRNKPFPTAADRHIALIDEAITEVKPLTMAQALGGDHLASFVSLKKQLQEVTQSAADFFDFEVKHRTNFLRKLETCCDTMLLRGRGILKAYVDPKNEHKIVFENVDPLFLLISDSADSFEDADEWIHVRHISVEKFKQDRRYLAGSEADKLAGGKDAPDRLKGSIDRLKGQRDLNFEQIFQDKESREGITHSPKSDTIVLWEHYVRTEGGLTVYTYAPIAMDIEIRKPYGVPYKIGGKVSCPFFSFQREVKDEGWYSPRGLAELIHEDEIFASKLANAWADALTFLNTPLTTSDQPIANPANYRFAPGEYWPNNMKTVQFGQPAMSYAEQMAHAKGEAIAKTKMPQSTNQGPQPYEGGKKETATKTRRVASIENSVWNHQASNFKTDLCKLYRHVWGLMLQFRRKELTYFISEDLKVMPDQALHDEYLILPGGSTDDWDKNAKMQKAGGRLEMLKGAPNVNQDELVRDVLAADDARLVNRLLIPQQQKAASEVEDETQEITSMIVTHFPAPVKPQEDHVARIRTLLQFMQAQGAKGIRVDPMAQKRIHEHLAQHLEILKQQQPDAYKKVLQMIQTMERQPLPATAGTGTQPAPTGAPPVQPTPSPMAML